jgi:hypothetical protein
MVFKAGEKHIPDPNLPPPPKKQISAINRLLRVSLGLAEDEELGAAQRLAAAKLGMELWSVRPKPVRKTDKDKLLINALKGSKSGKKDK